MLVLVVEDAAELILHLHHVEVVPLWHAVAKHEVENADDVHGRQLEVPGPLYGLLLDWERAVVHAPINEVVLPEALYLNDEALAPLPDAVHIEEGLAVFLVLAVVLVAAQRERADALLGTQ